MKKHLLLASLFLITLGIHSQNGAKCSGFQYAVENIANKFSKETVAPNTIIKQSIGPIENPNPIESEQSNSMPSTINWKLIGGTNNIFGSLESNSRPLQYNAKLNAVSFNYRKKDDDNIYTDEAQEDIYYGLIADEVEKVNKDLVFYNTKEDGTKTLAGVEYNKLISALVKSVQELKAEIDLLKGEPIIPTDNNLE